MDKVVVIGGTGFIGSYICNELSKSGYKVVIADIRKAEELIENQEYVYCDIEDIESIKSVVDDSTRYVYNFAAIADLDVAYNDPGATIRTNILGNNNVLEVCLLRKIKRYIFASSVYAFSKKGSFYGISKFACEKYIEEYYNRYGLEFTILRYGSLYGDKVDMKNGIYRMLKQAILDKKIIHKGNGEELREYIHCRDAAKLSIDILEPEYRNKHIVLTGTEKILQKDLLRMIKEIFNNEIKVEYTNKDYEGHYEVTPYTFRNPNLGLKLVANPFIDMGQGLLDCITSLYNVLHDSDSEVT